MTEDHLLERLIYEAAKRGAAEAQCERTVAAAEDSVKLNAEMSKKAGEQLAIIVELEESVTSLRTEGHNSWIRQRETIDALRCLVEESRILLSVRNRKRALPTLQKAIAQAERVIMEDIPF